jgi:uncharacterized protein YqjF (DUF2071 family)
MIAPDIKAPCPALTAIQSATARDQMLARRGEKLFVAGWRQALMIHFEVDAAALRRAVPFQLDLWQGRAFVSLVAFTMRGLRPVGGGKPAALMFRPIATHDFLNVRTYVRHRGERGIHFLAEWLNSRLAAQLGPAVFGLPYRHGQIEYQHERPSDGVRGRVADPRTGGALKYQASLPQPATFQPCPVGSLDEGLMERYIAFNSAGGLRRSFRVWHPPWPQTRADIEIVDDTLLRQNWPWLGTAKLMGANYSPGFNEVWMGRPHFCSMTSQRRGRFPHGTFFGEAG